jgi:D-alanine-D-alanine ligase-like ATP-grasp enzyme
MYGQVGQPNDMDAEWDTLETIEEIQRGLKQNKFEVVNLGDPKLLLSDAAYQGIDIVFSIWEMQGYRFREAIVPSLCKLLAIPYVFSPPDTMMISLDKNLCN